MIDSENTIFLFFLVESAQFHTFTSGKIASKRKEMHVIFSWLYFYYLETDFFFHIKSRRTKMST